MKVHDILCTGWLVTALIGCGTDTKPVQVPEIPKPVLSIKVAVPAPDPMRQAVDQSDIALLDSLYEEGRPIDTLDSNGLTLLHHAVKAQSSPVVEWLLNHGAQPNGDPGLGQSPLPLAIESARDASGNTAPSSNAFAVIRLLIQAGADPSEHRNGYPSAVQRAMDIECESCISFMKEVSLSHAMNLAN